MADSYIDQYETIGYGRFSVGQIKRMVLGLVPAFDKALRHVSTLLDDATTRMEELLAKSSATPRATYRDDEASNGTVESARDVLRRAVSYVESREEGRAIAREMLREISLTTVLRQRPAKLPASLSHAAGVLRRHKARLPEHAEWERKLEEAASSLTELNTKVRETRTAARELSPEVSAARDAWLKAYSATKLTVEAVLKLADKTSWMPELFDDLAEVHRVAGVTDEKPLSNDTTPAKEKSTPVIPDSGPKTS